MAATIRILRYCLIELKGTKVVWLWFRRNTSVIEICDTYGREVDYYDFEISLVAFKRIILTVKVEQVSLDVFGSQKDKLRSIVPKYFSHRYEIEAIGIDAYIGKKHVHLTVR